MNLHGVVLPEGVEFRVLTLDHWLGTIETDKPIWPGADRQVSLYLSDCLCVSFGVQILYSRPLVEGLAPRFISGLRFHYDPAGAWAELTTLLRAAS